MGTVQKSDSRLHSVDAKTLTWDLEAFHVTNMTSMSMLLLDNGNNSGHRGFLDKPCGLEWTGRFHLLTLEMIANEYFVESGFSICILIGCWSHMENVSDLI